MSCMQRQEVWRVPMKYCGIVDRQYGKPRGAYGEDYDMACVLDFEELVEEYAELFGYDAGEFNPSGSTSIGAYLDFILYDEDDLTWVAPTTYRSTPKSVFEKILPDIDLEVVHYCEFEWFNMVDAPDVY